MPTNTFMMNKLFNNTSTKCADDLIPRRIIISRKGWDAGEGCRPSPIFDDESMVSFPIPESSTSRINYSDVCGDGFPVGSLVEDLTQGRILRSSGAHLDPDLNRRALYTRAFGWRPSLGQVAGSQTHLMNNEVQAGDLFLFFGWFRRVRNVAGTWRYVASTPDLHILFGWLQISEMVLLGAPQVL
jgi:hypothetical protein